MKLALLALSLLVVASAFTLDEYQNEFLQFITKFGKKYEHDQIFTRFNTFRKNLDTITAHNAQGLSWKMGVNQFADMTAGEFAAWVNQGKPRLPTAFDIPAYVPTGVAPPTSFDWRDQKKVSPVKDQAQCGSCWAFSTVGTLESWFAIGGNPMTLMSEQQLVDCSTDTCYGCSGGWPYKATEYVMKNGLCSETDYPYRAVDQRCQASRCKPVIAPGQLKGYTNITAGESDFIDAVFSQGPISVLVEADTSAFQFYSSGVLDDPSCGTNIDHAILLVGYGTEAGADYWAIKNSWGSSWGDQGYIYFVQGKNQCGINFGPIVPNKM